MTGWISNKVQSVAKITKNALLDGFFDTVDTGSFENPVV